MGADSPSLASEFVGIRKRFPSAYIVGKEGESQDWRASVLVNSLESLGFLSVFKAYGQIVSVPEDNDDREVRISFSK